MSLRTADSPRSLNPAAFHWLRSRLRDARRLLVSELTEPQLRALKEIEAGLVVRDTVALRYRSLVFPAAVRSDTVERLEGYGLVALIEPDEPEREWEVLLTERGREVLADA
jgi:hypothetical protein